MNHKLESELPMKSILEVSETLTQAADLAVRHVLGLQQSCIWLYMTASDNFMKPREYQYLWRNLGYLPVYLTSNLPKRRYPRNPRYCLDTALTFKYQGPMGSMALECS